MSRDRDGLRSEVVELTQRLVRVPSVFGREGDAARAAAEAMEERGFDRVEVDRLGNAVGIMEGREAGPTLLLDAHVDTIDVIPRDAWTKDPFGGEVVGDRLYGRGSSDMKGALAAMIVGIGSLSREEFRGRVAVVGSIGEEVIEGIALEEVAKTLKPDAVVIGESTGLDLVRGGRGRAEFKLTSHGIPAHASTPDRGVNAIHEMRKVISEIESLPTLSHPVVGSGVMALTDICSQPYPAQSVVPSRCSVTYERRLIPGETPESVRELLDQSCRKAGVSEIEIVPAIARYVAPTGVELELEKWFPAWVMEEDSRFVQDALGGLRGAGLDPQLSAYQFCTNGAYSAGRAGIPTLGFGPSREELAHIIDEYVKIEELVSAALGYAGILRGVSKGEGGREQS